MPKQMNTAMKTTSMRWLLLLAITPLLTACFEDPKLFPCEAGDGVKTTETRAVAGFTEMIIDIPADIYLHQDTAYFLTIEAQENLMDWINTDVSGSVLEIRNERCFRQVKTIRIDVYLPELSLLEINGSSDVYGQDAFATNQLTLAVNGSGSIDLEADADEVDLDITGSGDIRLATITDYLNSRIRGSGDVVLSGATDVFDLKIEASGSVEAFPFQTNETYIIISGSGDAEVAADSILDVTINGSGDVYYQGNPFLDVKINGSGEVINAN